MIQSSSTVLRAALLAFLTVGIVFGCDSTDVPPSKPTPPGNPEPAPFVGTGGKWVGGPLGGPVQGAGLPPQPVTYTLRGTVTSATGSPIANATLQWTPVGSSTVTTTTDPSGAFTLTGDQFPGVESTLFTVVNSGFAPQVVSVPLKTGVSTYSFHVKLTTLQVQGLSTSQPTTFSIQLPGPGGTAHQATIMIPAAAAGTSVRVAPLDIGNSPGQMRAEGGPAGDALASLGMFYIDFVDGNGKQVSAPTGTTVTMGAQSPPTIPQSDPFNAWTLNTQGNWDNPQTMTPPTQMASAPPAPIPSFGYWNSDHAFRTACIIQKVQSPSGACAGARLDLTGPDGIHSFDSSDADGNFCLVGPQGHSGTLNITGGGTVNFPAQAGNCSVPSSCTVVAAPLNISAAECQNANGMMGSDGGVNAMCNAMQTAGNDAPFDGTFELGKSSGTFVFTWDMFNIPDQAIVMYEGKQLYDTGCASGAGSKSLNFSGASTKVSVHVNPNCQGGAAGTAWNFNVGCPL